MTRKIGAILGAVALVLIAGWYVGYWRPAAHQLSVAQASLNKAQDAEVADSSMEAVLLHKRSALASAEQTAGALTQAAPPQADIPGFIDEVTGLAHRAGVKWTSESQTTAASTSAATTSSNTVPGVPAGISPIAITMAVTGTQPQILDFIGLLQSAPRLYKITTLNLGTASSSSSQAPGAATAPAGGPGQAGAPGVITYSVSATMYQASTPLPAGPKGA